MTLDYIYMYLVLCVQVIVDQPEQPSTDQQQQTGTSQQPADADMVAAGHSTPDEEGWKEWKPFAVIVSTEC